MRNTALNFLKYTGIVTLSQYVNSKKTTVTKVHNAGSTPLFNFLTNCLVGDFDAASLDKPSKIMLLKKDTESGGFISASGFIQLLSNPEKVYKAGASAVRYSFIIPREKLDGNTFDGIGLYTNTATLNDVDNYAAFCEVKEENTTNISATSVLVVDWELIISNQNESV